MATKGPLLTPAFDNATKKISYSKEQMLAIRDAMGNVPAPRGVIEANEELKPEDKKRTLAI